MERFCRSALGCAAVVALMLASPATAAAQEEAPPTYAYVTYSQCDLAGQARADELTKNVFGPVYDEALSSGKILTWGWMAHHTGGKWRRGAYFVASGIDALLDAAAAINGKIAAEHALANREFGAICNSHDDYIWRYVMGSRPVAQAGQKRAAAGFSVYMVCDPAREERADAIVKEVMAPLYDQQVAQGALNSWSWFSHFVGGEWRRLAAIDGASHQALLAARDAIIRELEEKHADAAKEFDEICPSHQDYLWEIQITRP